MRLSTTASSENSTLKRSESKSKMRSSWKCASVMLAGAVLIGVIVTISAFKLSESDVDDSVQQILPILDTPIGIFKRDVKTSPMNGRMYFAYKGIPFAKPPIGDLRFARPVPSEKTVRGQIVNGQTMRDSCWSVTKTSTSKYYGEDCLYINIYTPYNDSGAVYTEKKWPVMIWIHGGGFVAGSAYPEPIQLVTRGEAIVVMVNYRLGTFGFLTAMDDQLPSNNGLWDQYLAIKWVYENIRYFQGDDKSITVFGESAGAMSAAFHAVSPVTAPYFHKAILQSGAATSLLARNAFQRTKDFANLVGCGSTATNTTALAQCLRNVSIADILENDKPGSYNIPEAQKQIDFIWMPVVDGEIIPDEPLKLLANTTYLKQVGVYQKDFLIGVLNDEGGLILENFLSPITMNDLSKADFYKELVETFIYLRYGADNMGVKQKIQPALNEFYVGDKLPTDPVNINNVLDMSSDFIFFVPSMEFALSVSKCSQNNNLTCQTDSTNDSVYSNINKDCTTSNATSKTFYYHFDFCPPKDPCSAPCMSHGEDVLLEFPKENFTDPILQLLSDQFIDILVSFARDSNPGQVVSFGWPEFERSSQTYLRLGPYPSVRNFLYNSRTTLWLERIPHLLRK